MRCQLQNCPDPSCSSTHLVSNTHRQAAQRSGVAPAAAAATAIVCRQLPAAAPSCCIAGAAHGGGDGVGSAAGGKGHKVLVAQGRDGKHTLLLHAEPGGRRRRRRRGRVLLGCESTELLKTEESYFSSILL